jgi:hypothetical protein
LSCKRDYTSIQILESLQNITNIAEDPKVSAKDRIKADWARRDIIILDLLKLEFEGPSSMVGILLVLSF